jgi:hypothetical protein
VNKIKKPSIFSEGFFGAGEGTRTPTVSRLILSQLRLPFRHSGILCGCAIGDQSLLTNDILTKI